MTISQKKLCRIKLNKMWLNYIKYENGCCVCCDKTLHTICLGFHHINPSDKKFNLSGCADRKAKSIIPELRKCVVVCENCHRLIHLKNIKISETEIKICLTKIMTKEGYIVENINVNDDPILILKTVKDYLLNKGIHQTKEDLDI